MRLIISAFLIFFAGWTISAHICVLLGLNLKALLLLTPLVVASLFGMHWFFLKTNKEVQQTPSHFQNWSGFNDKTYLYLVAALAATPFVLSWSWFAFWVLSILLLVLSIFRRDEAEILMVATAANKSRSFNFTILALILFTSLAISYAVSRSDLDDSFYVAIASFLSSHPTHAILSTDPMLGESGFPLIFPSYRFASFELLSGAIAYLLAVPAMDVYYVYLLPVWVTLVVAATFLLTRELIPKHWLLAGVIALFLTILLGEMHRSPANFSFVRIFQGKAVFLSVIVPTVFYLTAHFFSERGNKVDLFLLACCQVASVGLTNFGMLMGPIVGFGALMSNLPLAIKGDRKKFTSAFAVLLLPFPYLVNVALESKGSPVLNLGFETSANVWTTVFGAHQQYLVGFLILAGPVLAKDTVTRWRMSVPPLLLFAIYLNPWLAEFISKYVTTPPVYWRVVWSFPILVFAAVSLCMIVVNIFQKNSSRLVPVVLSTVVFTLTVYSLPFNTLRPENIGKFESFATWKVPGTHLIVAQKAIAIDNDGGRLLAPDEIAGVISRFEEHPRLISTRGMYIDLMKPHLAEKEFAKRKLLYDFVTGNGVPELDKIRLALRSLDVAIIVLRSGVETGDVLTLLEIEGYKQRETVYSYTIWAKPLF